MIDKREVCFLIDESGSVFYADVSTSPVALPDSNARWQAIWDNRDRLVEIAHSHPISSAHFSTEDETTISALKAALGKDIRYSVVSSDSMRVRIGETEEEIEHEPWWADLLRSTSGMK